MNIYLDNCCYNRIFDKETDKKIKIEKNAIKEIIKQSQKNKIKIYTSEVIVYEIQQIRNIIKRKKLEEFYESLNLINIKYSKELEKRVEELKKYNVKYMDAYHIAFAEKGKVDYFLTVDKKLINASKKAELEIEVINPIELGRRCFKWEVIQGGKI